jgi:galactokinase
MTPRAVAFAPGRINLIGEHTDYNDGLAVPFAVTLGVRITATALDEPRVEARALDLDQSDLFALSELGLDSADSPRDGGGTAGWRGFVRGAVSELQAAGVPVGGVRLEITGDVPRGSGLSSSAALSISLCLALAAVAGVQPPPQLELARLCQRIEHRWVGIQSGLLDQLASLFGGAGQAMLIDFRTLEVTALPLVLGDHRLVTLDSGERHEHSASGYNQRRLECAEACAALGIESLRDATLQDLAELPDPLRRRARHVITENARALAAVRALTDGDLNTIGELLNASHASLRDDYEVSTEAVEATVERLRAAGAIGARIVGGGFGGHVLALLGPTARPPAGSIEVAPGPGARLLA